MILRRVAQQLLHALVVALADVFLDPSDILAPGRSKKAAQISACVLADVLASNNKVLAELITEVHEAFCDPHKGMRVIFNWRSRLAISAWAYVPVGFGLCRLFRQIHRRDARIFVTK